MIEQNDVERLSMLYDWLQEHSSRRHTEKAANSFWNRFYGRITKVVEADCWQQDKQEAAAAIAAQDTSRLTALLNLHALNAALEATRLQDRDLALCAEGLRCLAEKYRAVR
ncbi:hypothetical protein [Hymenobacter koreensis]|uniref:hypothetical protein n=1 Tax=Hymenobacter koreensis TaxID=1084523 RepID=UPI0031ED69BB